MTKSNTASDNETDVDRYPTFILRNGRVEPIALWEVAEMTFDKPCEWHHFVPRRTIKLHRNNLSKLTELGNMQKMILLEQNFHRSLEGMEAKNVFSKTGVRKDELIYID